MAWPFTPITTYIGGSLPAVKSYDLNQLQVYVNHWINGTRSTIKLLVDGTGNVDSSAVADGVARLNGPGTDTVPTRQFTRTPTIRQLIDEIMVTGSVQVRTYADKDAFPGFVITVNAFYVANVGNEWQTDANARSLLFHYDSTGVYVYGHAATAPGAGTAWSNAEWGIVSPGSADFSLAANSGDLGVGRNITGLGVVTGGTGVTATTGNVTATAGDVVATVGSVTAGAAVAAGTTVTGAVGVTATTGNVEASAGVIRGRYIAGIGSTPTIAANANLGGAGAGAVMLAGTNSSGSFRLTCGALPSSGDQATITFAHGGYSSAPKAIIITPASATAAALSPPLYVEAGAGGISATVFDVTRASALTDTVVYDFHYVVIA